MDTTQSIKFRNAIPSDHERVIAVMPDWWGGRDLTASVLKLFFIHFYNTSFIAELGDQLVGFLIGFFSQAEEGVGYIHFAGVHPDHRKEGLGRCLFQKFFDTCGANHRWVVKSCTSPVNRLSIDFHQRMGFAIEPGDGMVEGVPVSMNFLRNNDPKVLFRKELN